MRLALDGFTITQFSAKPDGREIGVRAHDKGHTELLTFLFLTPEHTNQNALSCLRDDLKQIKKDGGKVSEQVNPAHTDTAAVATMLLTYPQGNQVAYKYAGRGDQCFMIEAFADKGTSLDVPTAQALLARQQYDPDYTHTAEDVLRYAAIRQELHPDPGVPAALVPKRIVTWYGQGTLPLPTDPAWQLVSLTARDNAARPIAQFRNGSTGVIASFILFENLSGKPTAESCRDDVMQGMLRQQGPLISRSESGQLVDEAGNHLATSSHYSKLVNNASNHDRFVFAGNAKTCAEIHVSTVVGTAGEEQHLKEALKEFSPDLSYRPSSLDYFALAAILNKESISLAAPYFDASLKDIPSNATDPDPLTRRRIATDVVVIALGMKGNLKAAREYATRAIEQDPDYPINYYNLACADAESGNASAARVHLEQAFARKRNVIPGESMPDPAHDDSILKLKSDRAFWTFVTSLAPDKPLLPAAQSLSDRGVLHRFWRPSRYLDATMDVCHTRSSICSK